MSRFRRLLATRATTRLEAEALPLRVDKEGAKEAFLCLHGFTGIPVELQKIGDALAAAGYSYRVPRNPGHGTDRGDFLATGAEDWLRRAMDAYLELRAEYEAVHLLGHSMGSLMAALVAATFGVPRLVLLAPAFKVSKAGAHFAPALRFVAPVIRRGRPNEETDPTRRRLFPEYWADDLVAGAAQLMRLRKAARLSLPRIRSKVLVLVAEKDKSVPVSVAVYLKERLIGAASFESATLAGVGHLFPFAEGSEEACRRIAEWCGKP